ncbi:MAG TPA: energy transducer TonB [Gemmatimonadales bacterium]|nr:energy transducer TonB [Gemmatimonadales bacterium]
MSRSRLLAVTLLLALPPAPAVAQSVSERFIADARSYIASGKFDRADTALSRAFASGAYVMDSVNVFVWRGILEHMRGSDSLARVNFRSALKLRQVIGVSGLDQISPGLAEIFEQEARAFRVYSASQLDQPAAWRSGPGVAYPAVLRHRQVAGHALVRAIVDTTGRVEEQSLEVLEAPDSAFNAPLRSMMLASAFTPGRLKGHSVRSEVDLGFNLNPPAPENPTRLLGVAREQLRARHADSALTLVAQALDSANQPSEGERVYALLVQGMAWSEKGKDSLATRSIDAGLQGYRDLTARGVDLAPFLKRLADSIRIARRGAHAASPFAGLTVVGTVDEPPVLVSHPAIRYAPEMQALRIGGTVVVEATLDTTGRVLPASVKIVQSPNPVFDAEAKRVVLAALYRPAQIHGRPARATIRQPLTFAAY